MRARYLIVPFLMLALLLSACNTTGSANNPPATTPVATQAPVSTEAPAVTQPSAATQAPAAAAASLMVAKNDKLGSFLSDSNGMSLYLFTKDTPNSSNCYDKCAASWPPLLTSGSPAGGDGVDASKLGTTTRKDGSLQVTYNGWPLYYFAKDKQAGDVTGQGVGKVWYVISPSGDKVTGQ